MNLFKTGILLAAMTALFMGIGYMIAGEFGMIIALLMAGGMNLFSWWNSGKMVLRMHNARAVDEKTAPELVNMVRQLADNAGLPMPDVYVLETAQPNAFATGRNPQNAAVAASSGLLDQLTKEEVAAVMAHELAHIKNRDTLTMTITATLAGAIGMLANFAMFFRGGRNNPLGMIGVLATMFLAPMAAGIVQMAVSRTREYQADKDGAEICGNPMWLASALDKIANGARKTMNHQAESAKATAHMFIINPLNGQMMDNLFSTHPDTGNRITALQELARQWELEDNSQRREKKRPQTKAAQRTKEIWGRDAGEWREENSAPKGDTQAGPWGKETSSGTNPNPRDPSKPGPWG